MVITRMITDRIGLYSVLLPLLIFLSQSTRFFPVLQAILPKEKTSRLIGYMQFDL